VEGGGERQTRVTVFLRPSGRRGRALLFLFVGRRERYPSARKDVLPSGGVPNSSPRKKKRGGRSVQRLHWSCFGGERGKATGLITCREGMTLTEREEERGGKRGRISVKIQGGKGKGCIYSVRAECPYTMAWPGGKGREARCGFIEGGSGEEKTLISSCHTIVSVSARVFLERGKKEERGKKSVLFLWSV